MKTLPGMYPGQDFTSSGIFTPKAERFGSGIFASGWSIPQSVYTEPMYVGAQVVPGDAAFFRSALSGGDGLSGALDDLAAKVPGGKLGLAALALLAMYFTVGIPVLGWKAGRARRNPRRGRRARRIGRRRRNPSLRRARQWITSSSGPGLCEAGGCAYSSGHRGGHSNGLRVSKGSLSY